MPIPARLGRLRGVFGAGDMCDSRVSPGPVGSEVSGDDSDALVWPVTMEG
jgi:hypothetical protein